MGLFDKLKPKQDEQVNPEPASDQATMDAFNKFSQANKANIGPNTSLGVPDTFKGAYQGAQDLRSQAIDKIIENTNIGKNVPEADMSSANEYGKMGLDMVLPDVTDLIPAGKLGHVANAAFPILGMAAKEGKAVAKGAKTAEEMMQGVRKAGIEDMKLGSQLAGKQVFDTAEQKAAKKFGSVSTPDIGNSVSHNDIMDLLKDSPSYQKHIADRDLFKTNPQAYNDKKDYYINKAREYLQQKKGK